MRADHDSVSPGKRLDTWKAISAFFARDERTVKRWEITRGLPVHRVPGHGRANVYAWTHELNAWLANSAREKAAPSFNGSDTEPSRLVNTLAETRPAPAAEISSSESARRKRPWLLAAVARMAAVATIATLLFGAHTRTSHASRAQVAKHVVQTRPASPQAEELYLDGMFQWNKRTPDSLNRAADDFSRALVIDPDFAEAYLGLANCYLLLREYGEMPGAEAYAKAEQAAQHALAINQGLSGAHASLGFIDIFWHWHAGDARREFQRAIALDPTSVVAHHWYATSLLAMHDASGALAEIERARQLDPQSEPILADRGLILSQAGQRERAIQALQYLEKSDPAFLSPHAYLADIYLAEGDDRDYLTEFHATAALLHDNRQMQLANGAEKGFATDGHRGMFEAMLDVQNRWYAQGGQSAFELARTNAWLGNRPDALRYLQIAYENHEPEVISIRNYPEFSTLHSDQAYKQILARMGLRGE